MSSATKVADEYAYIAARLAEIEKERLAAVNAEQPKPEHDYSAIYTGTYEDMVSS